MNYLFYQRTPTANHHQNKNHLKDVSSLVVAVQATDELSIKFKNQRKKKERKQNFMLESVMNVETLIRPLVGPKNLMR